MATSQRIDELTADRDFWDRLKGETDGRFEKLVDLQGHGVIWPNSVGGDDLAEAIDELDEAAREIAKHRTGAQARLDRARAGENV